MAFTHWLRRILEGKPPADAPAWPPRKPRAPLDEPCAVRVGGASSPKVPGRTLDLSSGGARVTTAAAPGVGERIRHTLFFPGEAEPAIVDGRVVWVARANGETVLGIAFENMALNVRERIEDLVARRLRDLQRLVALLSRSTLTQEQEHSLRELARRLGKPGDAPLDEIRAWAVRHDPRFA